MKQELISKLKECNAIQYGKFVLTSGTESDYYIDIKKASCKPKILELIAENMKKYTYNYDLLAGMELGAVPLIVALSLKTKLPYTIIRKESRDHGTKKEIEGEEVKDKKVLIIEDVTTTGGSIVKSINILRENKAFVDKVITVVDREQGAKEKLKQYNVDLVSLISVSEILKK